MMSIIDGAIQNARIDALAKQKAFMTKANGKDKTRRQRAKEANMREAVAIVPSRPIRSSAKFVRFGAYNPVKFRALHPLKGILKVPHLTSPFNASLGFS